MGNCFSSPKQTTYTLHRTESNRKTESTHVALPVTNTSTNTGYFPGARNLAFSGNQFLEVHGNYTVNSAPVNSTDDITPLLPALKHSSAMFTGRDMYLDRLKNHFSTILKERKPFLLHGMGGIGKTQICLRFMEKYGKMFSNVFWIDASSENSIDLRLRQIAKVNNAPSEATLSAASALTWIAGKENWLMIYDNADGGYKVVEKFLPPGNEGSILITSRNKDLMRITLKENSMEVLEMGEEEALSLLAKSAMLDYTSEDVKNLAKELVSKLGGVPLAIDQAGAYMLACNHSIEDYLELFIKHQDQLMSDPEFEGASSYGSSTYGTWEIAMKEIEARAADKEDPRAVAAESAITLQKIFAFLHHENIPQELFKNAAQNYNNRDIAKEEEYGLPLLVTMLDAKTLFLDDRGEWDRVQFQAGIQLLMSFSLLKSNGKMYSIHPLVHSWGRYRIPKTEIERWHLITKGLISCSVDLDDDDNFELCGLLVPHIRAANNHAVELNLKNAYYDDEYDRFAWVFICTASFSEAEDLQVSVMNARKAKLGQDHIHTLISMRVMGFLYWDQGRWDEVERLNVQIVETSRRILSEDDSFALDSMRHLAVAYWGQGKVDMAEKLAVQIVETQKAKLGEDHPNTLLSMESLAVTYLSQGRYTDAELLLLHVVKVREEKYGPNNYTTLKAMVNLACAYENQGRLGEAEKLRFHVFEAQKIKLGPNHPETLNNMTLLGSTYRMQGRVDEAHVLLSQAARLMEQTNHPEVLWNRRELDKLPKDGVSPA